MAWLIYGVPLKPRFNPHFEWPGIAKNIQEDLTAGRLIADENLSVMGKRKIASGGQIYPLPDLFKGCGAWIVCDEFKRIVDGLAPQSNQFFPVTLLDELARAETRTYHLMNVTQMDDTLDLNKSYVHASSQEVKIPSGEIKKVQSWHLDPRPELLVTQKSRVSGKHLWRGKTHFHRYLFFSDELMKRVTAAKFTKLISYRVVEE